MKVFAVESGALAHNTSTHIVTEPDADKALCGREWAGKPYPTDTELTGWQKVCRQCKKKWQRMQESDQATDPIDQSDNYEAYYGYE